MISLRNLWARMAHPWEPKTALKSSSERVCTTKPVWAALKLLFRWLATLPQSTFSSKSLILMTQQHNKTSNHLSKHQLTNPTLHQLAGNQSRYLQLRLHWRRKTSACRWFRWELLRQNQEQSLMIWWISILLWKRWLIRIIIFQGSQYQNQPDLQ